jgi:hypothetical protein
LQNPGSGNHPDETIWLQADIQDLDDQIVARGGSLDGYRSGGGIDLARITNAHEIRDILQAMNAPGRGVVGFDDELITWGNGGNGLSRRGKLVGELVARNPQHASLPGHSEDGPTG